jgi:DNA-nicking Smr family endonuclease
MSGAAGKTLSLEDRILWSRIARTTRPLKGRAQAFPSESDEPAMGEIPASGPKLVDAPSQPTVHRTTYAPRHFDLPTRRKLAKGRLPIEGTVDLHGLTQSEAHALLLSSLHRAYADGRRYVLVITGKGDSYGSDGILKRAVPAWFATAPFRALVSGQEGAGRRHGGAGALYVRLRRRGEDGRK